MSDDLIIKKDGISYKVPAEWGISSSATYVLSGKLQDNAYSHGSSVIGDRMAKGRNILISLDVESDTASEHDEIVNEIFRQFFQTDYDLYAGRDDRLYHINSVYKNKQVWTDGYKQRRSELDFTLWLADPFRYATEELSVNQTVTNKDIITIDNPGSVLSPLNINIAPLETAADVKIIHTSGTMQLKDSTLTAPATCSVSTSAGTVYRDSSNNINTFSGQFLNVNPGSNEYQYFGSDATLTFTFTPRWFI